VGTTGAAVVVVGGAVVVVGAVVVGGAIVGTVDAWAVAPWVVVVVPTVLLLLPQAAMSRPTLVNKPTVRRLDT
jgi:hypothetical protein